MARPLRIEMAGGLYHVTSRGDRQEPIFVDDADRRRLLEVVAKAVIRFDVAVYAYCLMGNHHHFVVRTRRPNLSGWMRHLNGVYAQSYNQRHGLVGHVFQGRFHAVHVDADSHFLEVCRYVDLNPVRAGLVEDPRDWAWSSYRAHAGLVPVPHWLASMELLGSLPGFPNGIDLDERKARSLYVELVQAGRDDRLWNRALRQEVYLGDAEFIAGLQARIAARRGPSSEIPKAQIQPPPAVVQPKGDLDRAVAMRRDHVIRGMTMTAIAEEWNLSISRVSRLIRLAEEMEPPPETMTD